MSTSPLDHPGSASPDGDDPRRPGSIAHRLDTRGLSCPMPIVRTAQAMADLAPGELLEVIAYSPRAVTEFGSWARSTGNPLVGSSAEGAVYRLVLRKTQRPTEAALTEPLRPAIPGHPTAPQEST